VIDLADELAGPSTGVDDVVRNVGDDVAKWLEKDARVITNKAGDIVVISEDGLRKIRFDFNNPCGDLPHVHLEVFENARWRDAIPGVHRIYPKGN
jgi:hypothetical protein